MKRKSTSPSAFFSPRVLISLAFCAIGLLLASLAFALHPGGNAFARQKQSSAPRVVQGNVRVLQATRTQEPPKVPLVSITPLEENGHMDMAALNIHPLPAPLASRASSGAPSSDGAAIGTGKAFLGITHEIVNQNTTNAFGVLSSGWTPGESVEIYLNGSLALTATASTSGAVAGGVNTNMGFGYITVDEIGLTSGKETGGVVQVAPTGPYLPGVTGAPHAVNTTVAPTLLLYGWGYPVSSPVTLYRDGVSLGTTTTNAAGRYFVGLSPADNGNVSAVYSSDNGTAGSMVGTTIEERSDAGPPPVGDENVVRAFMARAVLDSATGGTFSLVGEGFQAGETVTLSSCGSGTAVADANSAVGFFLNAPAGAGVYGCVLTGGTSGRVARASALAHANVTNLRGLIVAPSLVTPGGTVTILADKLPASDTGNIYLDGVLQGTATTNASGRGTFTLTKPTTGFVHAVGWIASSGAGDAQAAVLLLDSANPTPTASCPPTITQSSSQAIIAGNSVSCNDGGTSHADNSYWRAFSMTSFTGSAQYNVTSVSFGVETANVTQPVTVRLYTTSNFPTGFPGSLTQIGMTTISVTNAQSGTVVTAPLVATVPAGVSQLVMELFTPDGQAAGNLFFVGSNAAAETGPGYVSAATCGSTTPTTTTAIGFPNMHIVFNVNGSCGSGTPATLGNISTRLRVQTGNNVLIGGFIITGTQPKKVMVRAIGPSLSSLFPGALADPILELRDSSGGLIRSNDNWRSDQEAEIIATTIPPTNNLESAIVATLPANNSAYTAIVRGVNNGTGIGVVEAYDLNRTVDSKLANISTRGLVQTGDNVLIGGLIVLGQSPLRVIVRAIGPSLPVVGKLGDPTLELRDGNGALIASNNNWRTDQEAEIIATTIAPTNDLESAIVRNLAPGSYTAIVRGVNGTTGVALVEAYGLN